MDGGGQKRKIVANAQLLSWVDELISTFDQLNILSHVWQPKFSQPPGRLDAAQSFGREEY